jgi:teichuronic acid biosynthesis glycosyltransferase TuaC
MKISVLTTAYPTPEEPNRGAPIWATLDRFRGKAEIQVNCSLARSPAWVRRFIQPRSYLRYPEQVEMTRCPEMPAVMLDYFSLPGITRWFNGRFLARAFERRLAGWRPEVILAYRIYPDGYAAVAVGKRLGIPAVISSRGSDLRRLPAKGLARRDTIWAVRHADAVVCVSEDLMRIARSLGGSKVHLVRNGVNREVFHPVDQGEARAQLGIPGEQRLIVFVGNLIPIKDVPTLLRALRLLKDGGETWHVALIGEGRQEMELRQMAEQLGIAPQVAFLGARSAPQIAIWLNACDLFCLPSESEGLPNVVIEALACGRNVVGTNVGGIPELLNPDSGLVVPPGEPAALAGAVKQSGGKQWDRAAISQSYPWSWDEVAAQTIGICKDAMQRAASHR